MLKTVLLAIAYPPLWILDWVLYKAECQWAKKKGYREPLRHPPLPEDILK